MQEAGKKTTEHRSRQGHGRTKNSREFCKVRMYTFDRLCACIEKETTGTK